MSVSTHRHKVILNPIFLESQLSSPSALIELFEIDLAFQGGPLYRFHAGTVGTDDDGNEIITYQTAKDLIWKGETYTRFPIVASGFSASTEGPLPRPTLTVSNFEGLIGASARDYQDFRGCRVTRIRTFAKFLDAANFTEGNPTADPNQAFRPEIWFVARKAEEVPGEYVKFELASPFDVQGVKIPRRQMLRVCPAQVIYRGGDCGYTGSQMFDIEGNPTTDPAKDRCGHTFADCKLRNNQKNFGGFVVVGRVPL